MSRVIDPKRRRLFWFVFAGTRGGSTRLRIITALKEKPLNINQLAQILDLDYKSIQHHIQVLSKNNIITKGGEKYGSTYFISNLLEINMDSFQEITEKLEITSCKKKLAH